MISVTIIGSDPSCVDAYATAIFVMGLNRSKEFLKSENSISAVLIGEDLTLYVSSSLKDRVSLREGFKVEFI